ncbi:unnamed protein product [Heterobilharzia americana]|nr:unnamed protein product [Heterobilharzia americana]
MTVGSVYNEGRFPIPPKFDFRQLPLRGRKVTVISFIGDYDIFFGESQFINIFSYTGKEFPVSDCKVVRQLEQNMVTQIFNTFYETGLISNIPTNHLFMLPGHNFVRVLFENEYIDGKSNHVTSCKDMAQQYFEFILKNVHHISNMSTDKIPSAFGSSSTLLSSPLNPATERCSSNHLSSPPSPWSFPAPDQPTQHNLYSFLHLHVESMLDQAANRNSSYGQTTLAYELPTCKAWFMACYRIYTSLMSNEPLTTIPPSEVNTGQSDLATCAGGGGAAIAGVNLSQTWHNVLTSVVCPTLPTSTLSVAQKQTSQKSVIEEEEDLLASSYSNPWSVTDPINRLSVVRYRAAISAAETHYKQDLPVYYSCTYHMIKIVSAYNVAISLARGHSVFRLLEKLSSRLTHLYLAGRVTCSALSLTGQPCQHELHRVPDDVNTLQAILLALEEKSKENLINLDAEENLVLHHQYRSSSIANQLHGIDLKVKDDYIIPSGLNGKWKRYWIECAIKDSVSCSSNKKSNEQQKKDDSSLNNPDQHLAVMTHRSDAIMISSCGCGRQQAERSDPFDYKEANWRFYHILSNVCCNKLTSILLSPQILSDPNHTFCLPNEVDKEHHLPFALSADNNNANTKNEKKISILTKRKEVSSPPVSREHKLSEINSSGDNNDDNAGLSQPEDNDLLLLSADSDSSEVVDRKSSDSEDSRNNAYMDAVTNLSGSDVSPNDTYASDPLSQKVKVQRTIKKADVQDQKAESFHHSAVESKDNLTFDTYDPVKIETVDSVDPVSLHPVVFRDGVPNTNWFVGDLPRYPSWSIHALGKYFSYSHSSGLPCRGFIRNSNFLLPWDVSLMSNTRNRRFNKSAKGRHRGGKPDSDTVKLFIGFEMECSMGHRFFLTGTDRVMDGPMQSSQVRRAVHSLLTRDLPVFMPCQCHHPVSHILGNTRQSTGEWDMGSSNTTVNLSGYANNQMVMAQLSRIYLAIPAAPIRVRVQPCVRPGPPKVTPIFHLGHTLDQCCDKTLDCSMDSEYEQNYGVDDDCYFYEDSVKSCVKLLPDMHHGEKYQTPGYVTLDNGYLWVIRLPFVYHDGNKLYPKPVYPDDLNEWKLLRGCIQLVV